MSSHKEHSPQHRPVQSRDRTRPGAATKSDTTTLPPSQDPGRSGRPTFDSRGNAVWEWQTEEAGKFSKDVSTQRLKKLEAADLSIEETQAVKNLDARNVPKERGFNPYDRAHVVKAKLDSQTAKNSAAPERKPIKDLKRYDEWLKMKKRLEAQKEDD